MNVLLIAGKSELGGAPRSMKAMARLIHERYGVRFTVAVHREGDISRFCRENGLSFVVTGHEPVAVGRGSTPARRLAKAAMVPLYALRARTANEKALRILEERTDLSSFDLIHTNSNRDGLGAMAAEKTGLPHIWHIREYGKEDYDTRFLPPFSLAGMNARADRFVMISDALREAWAQKGLDRDKMVRLYNGIDFCTVPADPERANLEQKRVKLVLAGTLCPAKGQLEAIRALALAEKTHPGAFSLDLVGEGAGDFTARLKSEVRRLGLSEKVSFLGYREDAGKLMRGYTAGLVCSRAEAFGRITPEYMAAGLLTVASDRGANPELIRDGETGLLYAFGQPEKLAGKLIEVLEMPFNLRKSMSLAAEKDARERFSAETNAENVYRLYEETLAGRNR